MSNEWLKQQTVSSLIDASAECEKALKSCDLKPFQRFYFDGDATVFEVEYREAALKHRAINQELVSRLNDLKETHHAPHPFHGMTVRELREWFAIPDADIEDYLDSIILRPLDELADMFLLKMGHPNTDHTREIVRYTSTLADNLTRIRQYTIEKLALHKVVAVEYGDAIESETVPTNISSAIIAMRGIKNLLEGQF